MKILITGSKGQLGNEIIAIIKNGEAEVGKISEKIKNAQIKAVDIDELDITDRKEVEAIIQKEKPDVVINCAAATNVDGCESNVERAFLINSIGPRNLAIEVEKVKGKLCHISTDYVFSGKGATPIKEYENTSPASVYGKTKLLGEKYVENFCSRFYIVRTAWLYGAVGKNFVYTMIQLGKSKEQIKVVNDQRGNPTNANDLAYHILKLIETEEYGIYHCTGEGECSWFEFAEEIMKLAELNCCVNPCSSDEYEAVAQRPSYSSLDNMMLRCTIGNRMRPWQDALKEFINKVKNSNDKI